MKYPMVCIRWRDSFSGNHRWSDTTDLIKDIQHQSFEIESIGFLIRRDRRHVVLAQNMTNPDRIQAADTIAIPVGCVLALRRLQFRGSK